MALTLMAVNGTRLRVTETTGAVVDVRLPVCAYGAVGSAVVCGDYSQLQFDGTSATGTAGWDHEGARVALTDVWTVSGESVTIARTIRTDASPLSALRLALEIELPQAGARRFFVPGMIYSEDQWARGGRFGFADGRLAYPMVAAFAGGSVVSLERLTLARTDAAPDRGAGDSSFTQRTEIGSVGFVTDAELDRDRLVVEWPYSERDRSSMLDSVGTPASALYPLDEGLEFTVTYRLTVRPALDYTEAVHAVFASAFERVKPEPSRNPVTLEESIRLRLESAAKTFRRTADGFAGFVLNFDPERGYDSEAKAFGASFAEHSMGDSHNILEYGFTGRQLNLAYMLASRAPEEWLECGRQVVDSFVNRMTMPSGWVHTLWDIAAGAPLFACGDPSGPVMHYLGRSELAGTYTRMMAEAGRDLLLNVRLHREHGRDVSRWLNAATRLGDFFVRAQEDDGSWFRAYTPKAEPIVDTDWFGFRSGSGKTATGAVVPFLLALAGATGADGQRFRAAAGRAGGYVQTAIVASDDYRGGTLDNPNVVDKEAALIAMQAMLGLHDDAVQSGIGNPAQLLHAARRAATIGVTWHSIWEVPNLPDTALGREGARSVGWGGINSIWGVGVTDIYSLFFAGDLLRLGRLAQEPLFAGIAQLIACSSLQMLSVPGAIHGYADLGMQPEGISFSSQGVDEGLIAKGDTWGGLGWPYTAGTYGLDEYLRAAAAG